MPIDTKAQEKQSPVSLENSCRAHVGRWSYIIAIVALCAVPFSVSYNVRDRFVEEDEIYWIGQSYYYHLAFETREWSHPDWQLLPARENPVLGKYVIGAGLRLNGLNVTNTDWLGVFYLIAKDRPKAWGDEPDRRSRLAVVNGMRPELRELVGNQNRFEYPADYAITGRSVMLLFGVLSALTVFALTSLYTNRAWAFLAALLFALHPATSAAYTTIGVDILAIAFSLLAVLHFVLIERTVWRRYSKPGLVRALVCAGGGLSLAFAVGAKMNAAVAGFLGVALCLIFAVSFLKLRSAESKDACLTMAALLTMSFLVFALSNPGSYPNVLNGIWAVYADQQHALELQKASFLAIFGKHPPQTWSERFLALADMTAFHSAIFCLLAGAFLFHVIADCKTRRMPSVIAIWWFIALLMVVAWLPFARPRYALPVIAPTVILLCCAGDSLVRWVRHGNQTSTGQKHFSD